MKPRGASGLGRLFALSALCISSALPARADWLALSGDQLNIWRLDDRTGATINQFASLGSSPSSKVWFDSMILGPDGNVYAVESIYGNAPHGQILRYAPDGSGLGGFNVGAATNGNLIQPGALTFGPDGNIYVFGYGTTTSVPGILRYNGTNGEFLGMFVANPNASHLAFGKDGNLYVNDSSRGIVRYDSKGAYVDTFVPLGTGGLPDAANFIFGPDGNLYICSSISNAVARFDGNTGQFMDYFVASGSGGLNSPNALAFGPDGNLYVCGGQILRYDGRTGAFLNAFGGVPYGVEYLVYLPSTQPPQLNIQAGLYNTVQITWPSAAGSFWTLCQRQAGGATNAWAAMTNQAALSGTNYVITDYCTSAACFYRLQKQ